MTAEIRQCWAYNVAGNRCDHPAGHAGKHMIATEWDDSECYAPNGFQTPTKSASPVPPVVPQEPVVVTKCIACNHAHKSGVCKCGCHEFIG